MKNKAGKIVGFIVGTAVFLFSFKVFVLANVSPSDELAPGIVVMAAVFTGVVFGFLGNLMQNSWRKR